MNYNVALRGSDINAETDILRPTTAAYPWTPRDLGNALAAWWSADDHGTALMVDDGAGLISSWRDRINGINCTGTTTARPTWAASSFNSAYAGVTFDGTANRLTSTYLYLSTPTLPIGATAGNVIALLNQNWTVGLSRIFGYGQDGLGARSISYTSGAPGLRLVLTNENASLTDTVTTFTGNHIVVSEWVGTQANGWLNGTATTPATANVGALNTSISGSITLGAREQSAALFHKGLLRHCFVTLQLTTLQRQQLEGWLAWDSGLTASLPADHPFKSAAPTVVRMWQPFDLGVSLKAWWSADDHGTGRMTDDGAGLISSWKDCVSFIDTTAATTARPTWASNSFNSAYAGLTFDGVTNNLGTATFSPAVPTGAVPGNIAVLYSQTRLDGDTALAMIFGYGQDGGSARALYRSVVTVSRLNVSDAGVSVTDTVTAYNGNHIAIGEWAGTTQKGWIDGTPTTPASGTIPTLATSTTGGLRIAARMQAATLQSKGVYRHVFVTLQLTTLQRQQLEGWMAWDAGLVSVLPPAHPYKPAAPVRTWQPTDLGSSLKAWWNADDHGTSLMVDDGAGLISSWTDRVSGLAVTGTTTLRPTWAATSFNSAYAGLTFNGTSTGLATATVTALPTGSTPGEMWLLAHNTSAGGTGSNTPFSYGRVDGAFQRSLFLLSTNFPTLYDGTVFNTHNVLFNAPAIIGGNWAGTVQDGSFNGSPWAAPGTITSLATAAQKVAIGARAVTTLDSFFKGPVRHAFITTTLTALQRQQMQGWLAWDAGLTSLLPAGHPYKSVRP